MSYAAWKDYFRFRKGQIAFEQYTSDEKAIRDNWDFSDNYEGLIDFIKKETNEVRAEFFEKLKGKIKPEVLDRFNDELLIVANTIRVR